MAIREGVSVQRARTSVAHPWLLAWVALLPLVALRSGRIAESDTFWAIRTGHDTLTNGAIPSADSFSWTANGDPWTLNSWAFNVLLAFADGVGGLAGVAGFSALIVAGILALALLLARRAGAHPVVAAIVLQATGLVMVGFLSARPQLVDYAATLALVLLVDRIIRSDNAPLTELGWIGCLSVAWVNLHAAAPLSLAILGATAVMAALLPKARARAGWCFAACGAAVVGSLLNPYGADVLTQSFRVADASTTLIIEWQRLNPTDPLQLAMFIPGVVALVIAIRRQDIAYAAALAVLTLGSIQAMRVLPILALVAMPMLAATISTPRVVGYLRSRRTMLLQGATVCLAAMTVIGGLSLARAGQPDPDAFSPDLVATIPEGCDLYNSYAIGGYVIFARPDVRVSVDSRNDMYGAERVRASQEQLEQGPGNFLDGADCVLIPSGSALSGSLREGDGWKLVKSDGAHALFVRA